MEATDMERHECGKCWGAQREESGPDDFYPGIPQWPLKGWRQVMKKAGIRLHRASTAAAVISLQLMRFCWKF